MLIATIQQTNVPPRLELDKLATLALIAKVTSLVVVEFLLVKAANALSKRTLSQSETHAKTPTTV